MGGGSGTRVLASPLPMWGPVRSDGALHGVLSAAAGRTFGYHGATAATVLQLVLRRSARLQGGPSGDLQAGRQGGHGDQEAFPARDIGTRIRASC